MKIVMHCLYFPPEIGGLESHVFHLCKGLVEAGCDVSIVTSCSQEGLLAEEEIEGIRVFRTWSVIIDSPHGQTELGWCLVWIPGKENTSCND